MAVSGIVDPVVHTAYCTSLAFVDNTIYDTGHGHLPYRIGAALCRVTSTKRRIMRTVGAIDAAALGPFEQ